MKLTLSRAVLPAAVFCCLVAGLAVAAEKRIELTVNAGSHDRANTPVRVMIPVPAEAKSVTLTDPGGNQLAAQLTAQGLIYDYTWGARPMQQLHFILPSLKKGKPMKLTATVSTDPPSGRGFAWKHTPGQYAQLSYGTRPVLRYMCLPFDDSSKQKRHDTYKVFHHLYNPAGTQIVTKGPGGKYTHHRGLFFGFNNINYGEGRVDTWHCGGDAHQTHEDFLTEEAGPVLGRHTVAVYWHGKGKKVFAKERREMTVYNTPGGQLVEFASRLSSNPKLARRQTHGQPTLERHELRHRRQTLHGCLPGQAHQPQGSPIQRADLRPVRLVFRVRTGQGQGAESELPHLAARGRDDRPAGVRAERRLRRSGESRESQREAGKLTTETRRTRSKDVE